ncbi:hypothetical protein AMTRI_Chr04g250170 [Amborella trichopoda]|uniref:DUF7870 domain-containing protein n=1 Tax=Amborella trichopoda TaxID=13333 RepID=W1P5K5_AMBTC|nr:uncharacterized protein LOC18431019 [Amborella trichopoda]ERN02886.1 hypothetical protein AMTR_s00135p00032540 [Amborella trichopoda]|eukprot:XP_006841211.1 uncharacterized protein LOC18431019 [Amborella trichopoda]
MDRRKASWAKKVDPNTGPTDPNQLIIMLPNSRVMRLLARSVFLAIALVSFPWLGSLGSMLDASAARATTLNPIPALLMPEGDLLDEMIRDLMEQGLLKPSDKTLCVGIDSARSLEEQGFMPDQINLDDEIQPGIYDFVLASEHFPASIVDRALKPGGIAAGPLAAPFRVGPNFKIVYLRKFQATAIALKKLNEPSSTASVTSITGCTPSKAATMQKLEEILLEPPRESWIKGGEYLNRVKFLPNVAADYLSAYPRRVYIEVATRSKGFRDEGVGPWFRKHYPTNGQEFDFYRVEKVKGGSYAATVTWTRRRATREGTEEEAGEEGLSEWVRRSVREEEYVVMEVGGFDVVREMVESGAICLVDELFFKCPHAAPQGAVGRAYWECISLYGLLRERGVAAHQWWD